MSSRNDTGFIDEARRGQFRRRRAVGPGDPACCYMLGTRTYSTRPCYRTVALEITTSSRRETLMLKERPCRSMIEQGGLGSDETSALCSIASDAIRQMRLIPGYGKG